jgi:hypothetical protein
MHAMLAVAWLVLIAPTILWWRDSVLVVLFYSIYANFVGHWSAVEAARPSDGG